MNVSTLANLVDINQRSVSFFKGRQSDYMGIDDPNLEDMVHQWRRAIEPEERRAISADIQRLLADQLYWVNATVSLLPGVPQQGERLPVLQPSVPVPGIDLAGQVNTLEEKGNLA